MSKKILGICAALVALAALAIPASASAATTLAETNPPGTYVPLVAGPNTKVVATQDEESIFNAGGSTVVCTENKMTGNVHVNSDTEGITGTITSVSFQGSRPETKCESGLLGDTKVDIPAVEAGGHWCIKNVAGTDKFEFLGRGCTESGSGTLTFILTGSSLTCTYTRTSSVSGTFTTTEENTSGATLKVTGEPEFTEEGGKLLCPDTGKITKMAFILETDESETPVYIIDK